MSKHNYSQYSKNNKNNHNKVAEEELNPIAAAVEAAVEPAPEVEVAVAPVATVVETVPEIPVTGIVINCTKLNVRAKPVADAEVLCVLEAASEIEIDEARSTSDWYHIITATGVDGFCMRKFVKVNQ